MRCRETVEVLTDEIGEEFVIYREVKIKVRHGCLPTLLPNPNRRNQSVDPTRTPP
jgi:hypothetical protein